MTDYAGQFGGAGVAVPPRTFAYDAFLSYSRRDGAVAVGIQRGLHKIGRRPGQLHALRVFRDQTDLSASPDLWGRIRTALDASRYLVVVLSPAAVASPWVNKEVEHWIQTRGSQHMLLVLAGGTMHWDEAQRRFDPVRSTAALPCLVGSRVFGSEPIFVDVSGESPWDPNILRFRDKVADVAAPIHGKSKYVLESEDVREQRKFRRLRRAAILALVVLTVFAFASAGLAALQRRSAVSQRDQAVVQKLISQSEALLTGVRAGGDVRAVQQILAAQRISPTADPGAMFTALIQLNKTEKVIETPTAVRSLAFSPDGTRIFSGHKGGAVRVWDARTGQSIGRPLAGNEQTVNGVAIDPDGMRLVAATGDGLTLWDVASGRQACQPMASGVPVLSVAFSPDGGSFIATRGTRLQLWDAASCAPLDRSFEGHTDAATTVAFSPDGTRVVSGGNDDTVRVWDVATGRPVGSPMREDDDLYAVAFSPDGHRVVSGGEANEVRLWDIDTGLPVGPPWRGHTNMVTDVAFSPDGARVVSSSFDTTVRVWDAKTGQPVGTPLQRHTNGVIEVGYSPDGKTIASGSDDSTIRLWDTSANDRLVGHADTVYSVAYSPDGSTIASASKDLTVRLWRSATGEVVGNMLAGHQATVLSVDFSPDGRQLITGSVDRTLRRWDVSTGRELGTPIVGHKGQVYSVAYSPDGTRIVSGSDDGTVRMWDAATVSLARVMGPPDCQGDGTTVARY